MSMLLTWMSSGAGMPRLRTASTNPPVWKYALTSGNFFFMRARTRFMQAKLLNAWPSSKPTWRKAVLGPELGDKMDEKPGVIPMLATSTSFH
jgi:hypothetical protein